jgi:hypothetical protein
MRYLSTLLLPASLPLGAQAWDIRAELPFAKGQNLPQTLVQGTGELISGSLDTGKGVILSVSHRIIRIGPVLKFEWGVEAADWKASGRIQQGTSDLDGRLHQYGFGVGLNAQFWIPFTGAAGEMGLIQRFQKYQLDGANASEDHNLSRTWLRVGIRWRFPLPMLSPYVAASYQQPLSKDRPVEVGSVSDLATYFSAQGNGQEFQRLWTFGVGVQF